MSSVELCLALGAFEGVKAARALAGYRVATEVEFQFPGSLAAAADMPAHLLLSFCSGGDLVSRDLGIGCSSISASNLFFPERLWRVLSILQSFF